MKTEQALQTGTSGRQAGNQQGQGGTTMQATITRTGQSRQASMILALLIIGAVLVGGLVRWNARDGTRSDVAVSQAQVVPAAVGAESESWFPPQAHGYLPRAGASADTELTAGDFPPQAHGSLPRYMRGLSAELTAADFPPQAHGYLPQSIHDAGKAKAGCGNNSFPPQAQAYLPCQRNTR